MEVTTGIFGSFLAVFKQPKTVEPAESATPERVLRIYDNLAACGIDRMGFEVAADFNMRGWTTPGWRKAIGLALRERVLEPAVLEPSGDTVARAVYLGVRNFGYGVRSAKADAYVFRDGSAMVLKDGLWKGLQEEELPAELGLAGETPPLLPA